MKRVFLIVLDSVGIGEMPDAAEYGDEGSNTLAAAATSSYFSMPNMQKLGLFNLEAVNCGERIEQTVGSYARMTEASKGKDTTIGHWEIAGIVSKHALPTYPDGFPQEVINAFCQATGRKILCNKPFSGTDVIMKYGKEHMETGALIVYTSADSVFQIAAHEAVIPIEKLYEYCEMARNILVGQHGVGRVIARPFIGEPGAFVRTSNRHDFSIVPPKATVLNQLTDAGFTVAAVGKINDIFAGSGVTEKVRTTDNEEGIKRTLEYLNKEFAGLCFINLVDYDMLYGHRNDIDGYAKALTYFDERLPEIINGLKDDDILMITADHGCDPATPSTDHSREYTPLLVYGKMIKENNSLGTRKSFADIGATIVEYIGLKQVIEGDSMLRLLLK